MNSNAKITHQNTQDLQKIKAFLIQIQQQQSSTRVFVAKPFQQTETPKNQVSEYWESF